MKILQIFKLLENMRLTSQESVESDADIKEFFLLDSKY